MDSLFFSLIRLSLGTSKDFPRQLLAEEWAELYRLSVKQSLIGVCFVGVRRYLEFYSNDAPPMPKSLYFKWLGAATQIQQRNEWMNQKCVELHTTLTSGGLKNSILKGQGIAMLYGELSHFRQSGDIDIYVDCGRKKAIEYAQIIGQQDIDWDYKHLHLKVFKDTEVEMHYRPEVLLNLIKNRKLQQWFSSDEVQQQIFQKRGEIFTPSVEFNLFYILLHIYRHFLYEGIGLRQLLDYYFVLKSAGEKGRDTIGREAIELFGLKRFAKGIMWIMQTVLGLEKHYLLYEPNEEEGKYILSQIMEGGNFGHHNKRLNTKKNFGKLGAIRKILKHNLNLLGHYTSEVIWAPIWIVFHWSWKRWVR